MDTIIAHVMRHLHVQLQRAASHAASAASLQTIARAMANLECAATLIPSVNITAWYEPDGGPKALLVPAFTEDGSGGCVLTTIGSAQEPWSCTCGGDPAAYQRACEHLLAGRILRDLYARCVWQRQRIERRTALAEAFAAEAAAIRTVRDAHAAYEAAANEADRACMARIAAQQAVCCDDAEAAAWGLDDPDDCSDNDADSRATVLTRVAA